MSAQYILSKVNAAVAADDLAYLAYVSESDGLVERVCASCDKVFLGYDCDYICDDCCLQNIRAGNVDSGHTPEEDMHPWDCECPVCYPDSAEYYAAKEHSEALVVAAGVDWDFLHAMPLPTPQPVYTGPICYFCGTALMFALFGQPDLCCPNCDIPF